jgi:hypothetical protein
LLATPRPALIKSARPICSIGNCLLAITTVDGKATVTLGSGVDANRIPLVSLNEQGETASRLALAIGEEPGVSLARVARAVAYGWLADDRPPTRGAVLGGDPTTAL